MSTNIKLRRIIDTLANIAPKRFAGRGAWATDLARWIFYYDANNYAVFARKDVAESFTSISVGNLSGTGIRPLVADASGSVDDQDAATFRGTIGAQAALGYTPVNKAGDTMSGTLTVPTLKIKTALVDTNGAQILSSLGAYTGPSVTATNLTAGRVVRVSTGGQLVDDAGLTTEQTSGVTTGQVLGDGATAGYVRLALNAVSSNDSTIAWRWAGATRWAVTNQATTGAWRIRAFDAAGVEIDQPIDISNASGGAITLGGTTSRPVKIKGALQDTNGAQILSSLGAYTGPSVTATNLAGGGAGLYLPLATDNAGAVTRRTAAQFLSDIGAASSAGSVSYIPLFTGRRTVNCPNGVETAVTPAYTLAANWWKAGKRIRIELSLFAAHNATVIVYIGSRYFATFSVVAPFRGKIVSELVCQSAGASGRFAFLGWVEIASTSGDPTKFNGMNSPVFGDSQAYTDGIGEGWTIDTTASADIVVKISSSYGENIPMPYGSITVYNP